MGLHDDHVSKVGKPIADSCSESVLIFPQLRLCTSVGQPALMNFDAYHKQSKFKEIMTQLPATLQLQFKLANTLSRAHRVFIDHNLLEMTRQQERALDSVIQMFLTQLEGMENAVTSGMCLSLRTKQLLKSVQIEDIDLLFVAVAKLEIYAMHFFKPANSLGIQTCHSIFDATKKFFDLTLSTQGYYGTNGACPCFLTLAILMGQSIMTRILKGPCATFIHQELGSTLFLNMSKFLVSCSTEQGDASERGGKLGEQLFKNENVFRDQNGIVNVDLRVRNKLASSLMADMVLRWKNMASTHKSITVGPLPHSGKLSTDDLKRLLNNYRLEAPELLNGAGIEPNGSSRNNEPLVGNIDTNLMIIDDLWSNLGLELTDDWGIF